MDKPDRITSHAADTLILERGKKRAEELGLKLAPWADRDKTFYPSDDIHKLLGEGVNVVGSYNPDTNQVTSTFGQVQAKKDHDQALLIGIKPIVKDTAEGLLQEIWESDVLPEYLDERVKALLEKP